MIIKDVFVSISALTRHQASAKSSQVTSILPAVRSTSVDDGIIIRQRVVVMKPIEEATHTTSQNSQTLILVSQSVTQKSEYTAIVSVTISLDE